MLVALRAPIEDIFGSPDVGQYVVDIAFHYHATLLVSCNSFAVNETFLAETGSTMPVEKVLTIHFTASHTPELVLLLDVRGEFSDVDWLHFVLVAASIVVLHVHHLAA